MQGPTTMCAAGWTAIGLWWSTLGLATAGLGLAWMRRELGGDAGALSTTVAGPSLVTVALAVAWTLEYIARSSGGRGGGGGGRPAGRVQAAERG